MSARKASRKTARQDVAPLRAEDLDLLRKEIEGAVGRNAPLRINPDPEEVQRSVAKLVLTLVEFVRRLLERQALRRMEEGTLNTQEVEAVGLALMRLEETLRDMAGRFGLDPDDLNLDLGPLGKAL